MSCDLAVIFDVAGTMLKMYRVAKDISRDVFMEGIVTTELVMEKGGRALVIPQLDPKEVMETPPEMPLCKFFRGRDRDVKISCSSTPVIEEEAISVLLRSEVEVRNLQETLTAVCARCPRFYYTTGLITDVETGEVTHSISTGGMPFPALEAVLKELEGMGADIYVASGDSMRSLSSLTKCRGIKEERIYPASKPRQKEEIVKSLKNDYRLVVMVGDGLNDRYALEAADLGVLTVQQDSRPRAELIEAADEVIDDIRKLPGLVRDRLTRIATS
ncbi:MAG TPA: HAD family hydrolase [Methanothrix sp.]|nr:HAD family hydrolase [Methanothrix sp.]HPJ84195.1 HAD family hydrolase [Methanothrix sp.]HPR66870.1 HAD family hydrolase [Methanothrix sp.]